MCVCVHVFRGVHGVEAASSESSAIPVVARWPVFAKLRPGGRSDRGFHFKLVAKQRASRGVDVPPPGFPAAFVIHVTGFHLLPGEFLLVAEVSVLAPLSLLTSVSSATSGHCPCSLLSVPTTSGTPLGTPPARSPQMMRSRNG